MKPIQTWYGGCHFRSRIEFRWAVFFDALDLKWEYEKEGYALPSGAYLPDFWLPEIESVSGWNEGHGVWFEVKGEKPNNRELSLMMELAKGTGKAAYLVYGPIPHVYETDLGNFLDEANIEARFPIEDSDQQFCICRDCGKIGIEYMGLGSRICQHNEDEYSSYDHPRLIKAYVAASSARF